jgi:hypothetical protein
MAIGWRDFSPEGPADAESARPTKPEARQAAALADGGGLSFRTTVVRTLKPAGPAVDDPVPAAGPALNDWTATTGGHLRPCLVTAMNRGMRWHGQINPIGELLGMPLVDKHDSSPGL